MSTAPQNISTPPITADVVILGAGAAGLMAAIEAGRRDRRVLVLDHADRPGKKILISGGGRCNFTNRHTQPEHFLSANPHFAKSALAQYTPGDFLAMVERHRIPFHEKTLGQLFCDRSARDIVAMLERECAEAPDVRILCNTRILAVHHTGTLFRIARTSAPPILAESLIVATGGLSIPKMGATALGYDLAVQFGHPIVPCRPALVPLTFTPEDLARWADLAGLSTEVTASTPPGKPTHPTPAFREKMLLTHRGVSGPAILQISSFWQPGSPIHVDLAPGHAVLAPLLQPNARRDPAALAQALRAILPARLADRLATLAAPSAWTNPALATLEHTLHHYPLHPAGTEGYPKAEVTAGGVDTAHLNARTMQSKLLPGLFFIGEVVDVTGWLGGFNFQWAWASGAAAGRVA